MRAGEKPAESAEAGMERKPGKGWRKAKSVLNLFNHGSAPSDMPSSDTALAQHQTRSLRGLPRDHRREGMVHRHSQSVRDLSREERYRRPSNASSASTATTISSSSDHQGGAQDALEQMRLEVEQLKRRDDWVSRQQERLSLREMHENSDPRPAALMQANGASSRGPAESQLAKQVSLKEQLRVQSQALLEWQPANYLPPLDPDLHRRKEARKVFKARNSRK